MNPNQPTADTDTLLEEALSYHRYPKPGKTEVVATKPVLSQRDLALAYTPGVAEPCRHIARDVNAVFDYTNRGNLVAVVTNGTAVLGLGNIGPEAAKPVMEGKGVLFKRFADIDVFDIELNAPTVDEVIAAVTALAPTFGGINLEDIKAPDCFIIERELRQKLDIPVFHDDQHGTAIILAAALLNALELQGKSLATARIVCNGAGAAAIACMELLIVLGARREAITMVDSKGVIHAGRDDLNSEKLAFAHISDLLTLSAAAVGADVLVGLSVGGAFTPAMVASMGSKPVVCAMANPDPEIMYEVAKKVRSDLIMATGRSDTPNQINNVLGFPSIFRGALDVRARQVNDAMLVAATQALAALAREEVPGEVLAAYDLEELHFGPDYIIPKPFDPRVLTHVAPAVARAAVASGVARRELPNLDRYEEHLAELMDRGRLALRSVLRAARRGQARICFPEGELERVQRAAAVLRAERIGEPVLIGDPEAIARQWRERFLPGEPPEVIDLDGDPELPGIAEHYFTLRSRRGVMRHHAIERLRQNPNRFGAMLLRRGRVDALITGVGNHYPQSLRPILTLIPTQEGVARAYGVYLMVLPTGLFLLADTTVNPETTPESLAECARLSATLARRLGLEPRVAMLAYGNFGSADQPECHKVRQAVALLHRGGNPGFEVEGEMQADTAVVGRILAGRYPFSRLTKPANVLIFPNLAAGNIAYKLLSRLGGGQAIGPVLVGLSRPAHVLQIDATVEEIVNLATVAAMEAVEGK
ncbi:MAG: NADP-dependent malic enzyme [Alphaproteobacteria bacterium CG_4_10_14_0_2_um_filter_63_37]|nr:MAG: NADP-dependent malic enzyme [Proteobacteria bacterium CG1_02_64_396]PJA23967.1 MAG: NADP-dependent malic enzyme [Alphaproteobacteria bacterium CG_4_10_14_0_2_um_filter_63_37]